MAVTQPALHPALPRVPVVAPAPIELPTTVVGLRALARELGLPSKLYKSARKAELQALLGGAQ